MQKPRWTIVYARRVIGLAATLSEAVKIADEAGLIFYKNRKGEDSMTPRIVPGAFITSVAFEDRAKEASR